MKSIKVLLVLEVRLIGDLFASVLQEETDIEIAGWASDPEEAMEFLHAREVDVVIVSAELPNQKALKLTRTIVEKLPAKKVLILGLSDENRPDTLRYIEAGAAGYILKDSSLKDLTRVIRLAHRGEAQVSPRMAGVMMERLSSLARLFSTVETKMDGVVKLTSRELEVLQFIGDGLTNQEIAARLVVEVGTVKNHVHRILEKLHVSSRHEAASYLAVIKK